MMREPCEIVSKSYTLGAHEKNLHVYKYGTATVNSEIDNVGRPV